MQAHLPADKDPEELPEKEQYKAPCSHGSPGTAPPVFQNEQIIYDTHKTTHICQQLLNALMHDALRKHLLPIEMPDELHVAQRTPPPLQEAVPLSSSRLKSVLNVPTNTHARTRPFSS